jgi:hypothetical protein
LSPFFASVAPIVPQPRHRVLASLPDAESARAEQQPQQQQELPPPTASLLAPAVLERPLSSLPHTCSPPARRHRLRHRAMHTPSMSRRQLDFSASSGSPSSARPASPESPDGQGNLSVRSAYAAER